MIYERFAGERRDIPSVYYSKIDSNLEPGIIYGPVIRDAFVIELCTSGLGSVIINGTEFPVSQGDCYFLFPGDTVTHTADKKEPRCGYWTIFDGINVKSILKRVGITSEAPFAPEDCFEPILKQLKTLYDMRQDMDNGAAFRRAACIYSILGELLKTEKTTDKNLWVQQAIGIMESKYSGALNVSSIAEMIGLERSYFSTLFKAQTGVSPYVYLTDMRINKARVLLKDKSLTVSEVADAVGIDSKNFSRIFKQKTGMSPTKFKNNFK